MDGVCGLGVLTSAGKSGSQAQSAQGRTSKRGDHGDLGAPRQPPITNHAKQEHLLYFMIFVT